MTFNTKEELIAQAEKDKACEDGLQWAREQESLEDILENILLNRRLWCIWKGYEQFAELCDWRRLEGWQWVYLLTKQPQFSELCDWSKLDGYDLRRLVAVQPQLAEFCDWSKLSGDNWTILLELQPHFAEFCDWSKLDGEMWAYLLEKQPQFIKYKRS